MDFKYINDRNKTPNSKIGKRLSSNVSCDSPFRILPNFSTPPSRFTRIVNPFEQHLVDRLHLPVFSPSVFAKVSTPKTEEKFKWTIDDISSLKPADIDEDTFNQHVFEEDPQIESLVQQRIDSFFSEKAIVPSPMTDVDRVPLIAEVNTPVNTGSEKQKQYCEGYAQTVLTLPPILPAHLEEALKPYFSYTQDQQNTSNNDAKDEVLYRELFDFDQGPSSNRSNESSPALSVNLSPLHLSPLNSLDRSLDNPYDMPELRDCTISPISKKSPKECRSACRLNFSGKMSMSVDASVVPDIANQMSIHSTFIDEHSPQPIELLSDSTVNWDMEYRHVSLASPETSRDSEKMDVSNSNTPHSKIFTSQRKRLSDSFKDEEDDCNKENQPQEEYIRHTRKLFRNDTADTGYHTETGIYEESYMIDMHVFASTPSKKQN